MKKIDTKQRLEKFFDLDSEVEVEGAVIERPTDNRVIKWYDDHRGHTLIVFLAREDHPAWIRVEEEGGDQSKGDFDYDRGPFVIVNFGCHVWHSFYDAFEHYDAGSYQIDHDLPSSCGRVVQIREALRRAQEKAIEFGWIKERASNSLQQV